MVYSRFKRETYPQRIVGPGGPLHFTNLNVEGEILDTDVARRLIDPVREPSHDPRVIDEHVGIDDGRVVPRVGANDYRGLMSEVSEVSEGERRLSQAKLIVKCWYIA